MNLAVRDVRHNLGRFALTAIGLGMLLMIVMGMGGIYQGIVEDATLLVDRLDADLWIVQRDTRGPFAELSKVPETIEDRARTLPGVTRSRRFITHTIQREFRGQPLRMQIVGLSWPDDRGEWIPLANGRSLTSAHYEIVADESLGFALGDRISLGKDTYMIVGVTRGMVGSGGDGLAFTTVRDARTIQFDLAGEATRVERAARKRRAESMNLDVTSPQLIDRADRPASEIPALASPSVSAVLVDLAEGADREAVREMIDRWQDVTAYTADEQRNLLLRGPVDRARRQIGMFRALLVVISAILMALILYTLTLDKVHDIALIKLMGGSNLMILRLVLQEAFLLGAFGYILAFALGRRVFPLFPRRVIITDEMYIWLALAVSVIAIAGSVLGIARALKVRPNEVLA